MARIAGTRFAAPSAARAGSAPRGACSACRLGGGRWGGREVGGWTWSGVDGVAGMDVRAGLVVRFEGWDIVAGCEGV